MNRFGDKLLVLKAARRVKRSHGKGFLSQFIDIARLRFGPSRLAPMEYYQFGLFNDERYSFQEKSKFLGSRGRYFIDRAFNLRTWHVIHSDKVITALLLERLQIPCPKIWAVFDLQVRAIPGIRYLRTEEDLDAFLRDAPFPLFIKPVDAALGRDAMMVVGYDSTRRLVQLAWNGETSLDALHERCLLESKRKSGGTLFQEVIKPAPELAALTGGRLAGLRLIVLEHEGEFRLIHSVIKFTVGTNVSDNLDGGKKGNVHGRVNSDTGVVEQVFRFDGEGCTQVELHPDTGRRLVGFSIPQWTRCRSLVLAAASVFPGLKLQHWDVSIGERGPEFLEVNIEGGLDLPQIVSQRGFFDGSVAEAFRAS